MAKVIGTKGAIPLKSTKEMKSRGYEVSSKNVAGQEGLHKADGPKGKSMVCKLIELKQCTPRYKVTMERYSLKIIRFIGKKPLLDCFPKVYDIFLVDKIYYIFMGKYMKVSIPYLNIRSLLKVIAPASAYMIWWLAKKTSILDGYANGCGH